MKISEIITDKYKLRIPPTVFYDLLADVREVEEEQEPFINKPCVSEKACEHDKQKVLDKLRAEIEQQEKWLMIAGYNAYNADIAFNAIKSEVAKYKAEKRQQDED